MQNEQQERLIQAYIDAYNAFDVDGMVALLSPGVQFENWSGGALTAQASGADAFRQLAEQAKGLFAEREQRIIALRRDDGEVVVEIAWRGVLAVDVPDGPPRGTALELQGESVFGFEDGLIARIVDRS